MCGRYVSVKSDEDLSREFDVEEVVDEAPTPSWNVAPTDQVRIVARRRPHGRSDDPGAAAVIQLRTASWGLVPGWAKDRRTQGRMFNARSESLATTSAFRGAYAKRRCLVPADGWYEWQATEGPTKQPIFMTPVDGHVLALAGLYEFWRDPADPEAPVLTTCTVVTAAATGVLAEVHDRMPLALGRDVWSRWLDPSEPDPAELLVPKDEASELALELRPVATLVNRVQHDGPELVARAEPQPVEQKLF